MPVIYKFIDDVNILTIENKTIIHEDGPNEYCTYFRIEDIDDNSFKDVEVPISDIEILELYLEKF
jgi:hypothetical protein